MTELSQTVINLETKVVDLEADLKAHNENAIRQGALIKKLEADNARLSSERDSLMRRNENLHAILEAAAALIVDGLKKIDADNERMDAVAKATQSPNFDPDMGTDRK